MNKNKFKKIITSLLVIAFFWNSSYLQYIPVYIFKLDIKNISKNTAILLSFFSSLVVAITLLIVYRKDLKNEFKKFKNNISENMNIGIKYWFIGLLAMIISNLIITFILNGAGPKNENIIQSMIKINPFIMIITTCIIAPFNEEIVFRKTIKDIIKNKWVFALLAFILFGGAHVITLATCFTDYLYIIPYGSLGAAFALTYYESDTIYTSMFMHILHNSILMLLSLLAL